jgi:hypothetical protein
MEVEPNLDRVLRIWWALLWRLALMTLSTFGVAWLLSFPLDFAETTLGLPHEDVLRCGLILVYLIGLVLTLVPVWWVVNRDYGDFRLSLVARPTAPEETGAAVAAESDEVDE